MCFGKLGEWVHTQTKNYKFFKEGKYYNNMTAERIELLKAIDFTWSVMNRN